MSVELLRGMRDFNPEEAIKFREMVSKIEDIFKRFGFYPIETPSMESGQVLNAKAYGQEANKEMYMLDGGEAGMIYDLTVPLARYVAMNRNLTMPFKRYQIARTWRRDEPQKMRSREFTQADIDVVGSAEPSSEAEVIGATALAIESLGVMNYDLLISSRVILNSILNMFGIPLEKHTKVIITIDKLGKISRDEAMQQIAGYGIEAKIADGVLSFISEELPNEEKLKKLAINAPDAKTESERLGIILGMLSNYHISGRVRVDFSLARGLDYYTGTVWEFVAMDGQQRLPTIAGGGRYDSLIGIYSKTMQPAVGSSIGISRIFDLVKSPDPKQTYAQVYVANIGQLNFDYAVTIANFLRSRGVRTDLNLTSRGISKQLEYANSMHIKYAAIVGDQERQANKVKLRDMSTGSEELLDIEEVISKIQG